MDPKETKIDDPFEITDQMLNEDEDISSEFTDDLANSLLGKQSNPKPNPEGAADAEGAEEEEGAKGAEEDAIASIFGLEKEKNQDESEIDVEAINKMLNTNFKTKEEVQQHLAGKKDEQESEIEIENKKFDEIENNINFYSDLRNLDNESLIRENMKNLGLQNNQDITSEEFKDNLESQIEEMRDKGTLNVTGNQLRMEIDNRMKEFQGDKKEIETKREQRSAEAQKKLETNLISALSSFYKADSFLGVKPTEKNLKSAFEKSKTNSIIDLLRDNPQERAKVALFLEMQNDIASRANAPDFNDGIQSVMKELKPKKSVGSTIRSAQVTGTSATKRGEDALVAGLLAQKPKAE
jgi:hypothetical protein